MSSETCPKCKLPIIGRPSCPELENGLKCLWPDSPGCNRRYIRRLEVALEIAVSAYTDGHPSFGAVRDWLGRADAEIAKEDARVPI